MKITVLYFAYFKDSMGRSAEEIEVPDSVDTFEKLTRHLIGRGDPWKTTFANPKRLKGAVDHELADEDTPISEGAEVAFFPPVTGG